MGAAFVCRRQRSQERVPGAPRPHRPRLLAGTEDALDGEGWGAVNSCLAKDGLLRCKVNVKQVHVYDKDKCATATPQQIPGWVVNVLVKLIGKWQTPDGSAAGLNLLATDIQLLRPYQRARPF